MASPNNSRGRPPKFTSPEDMQLKIDAYFAKCDARTVTRVAKDGTVFTESNPEPYTMSGLAYALDMDRASLVNYAHKDDFFDTVKKARMKVQVDVERRLMEGQNQTGAIFNLKNNFNWKDKQENEFTGPDGGPLMVGVEFLNAPRKD